MRHMRGQGPARRATNAALGLVMEAIGAKAALLALEGVATADREASSADETIETMR